MANAVLRRIPLTALALALVVAGLVLPSSAAATPSKPKAKPTIAQVQHQLQTLLRTNSQLVDRFDRAQSQVRSKTVLAEQSRSLADHAAATYRSAREELGIAAAAQYEGGSFSQTGALLSSDSGSNYMNQMQTLTMISSHMTGVVKLTRAAHDAAVAADTKANSLLAAATASRDAVAKKRTLIRHQLNHYKTLLDQLDAAQRAAYLSTANPVVTKYSVHQLAHGVHGTAAAQQAVRFALAQVGKPYVFGSAGPDTYDCSGLTMRAWGSAGVSLPHSALEQYNYGTHVSFSQLRPGDLMFYYTPIGHVTIYIGNGLMVSAPETGENVSIVSADAPDFVGATRLS